MLCSMKSLLNMKSYNQRTALHEAADSGCLRRVKALLNAGAEVNCTDSFGQTPLHVAAKSGHYLIVEPLLRGGADIELLDCHGRTPLHLSAQSSVNCCRSLTF